jgi:hypothetical protein
MNFFIWIQFRAHMDALLDFFASSEKTFWKCGGKGNFRRITLQGLDKKWLRPDILEATICSM